MGLKRSKHRRSSRNVLQVKVRTDAPRLARWRYCGTILAMAVAALLAAYLGYRGLGWVANEVVYGSRAFLVKTIRIDTDGRIPEVILQSCARVRVNDNLLKLDLERIKRRLEHIPLVRSVSVHRALPDSLQITVSERRLIARVPLVLAGAGGKGLLFSNYYLDSEGYVIRGANHPDSPTLAAGGLAGLTMLQVDSIDLLRPAQTTVDARVLGALEAINAFNRSEMAGRVELAHVKLDTSDGMVLCAREKGRSSEITFDFDGAEEQLTRWRRIYETVVAQGRYILTLDASLTDNVPGRIGEEPHSATTRESGRATRQLGEKERHV